MNKNSDSLNKWMKISMTQAEWRNASKWIKIVAIIIYVAVMVLSLILNRGERGSVAALVFLAAIGIASLWFMLTLLKKIVVSNNCTQEIQVTLIDRKMKNGFWMPVVQYKVNDHVYGVEAQNMIPANGFFAQGMNRRAWIDPEKPEDVIVDFGQGNGKGKKTVGSILVGLICLIMLAISLLALYIMIVSII